MKKFLLLLSLIPTLVMGASYETKQKEVIIVGSGISGLTAAAYLKREGTDATVYEGRNRIGGRTHTDYLDESKRIYIEKGGTFIDKDHETVIELARKLGVPLKKIGFGTLDIVVRYKGCIMEPAAVIAMLEGLFDKLTALEKDYQHRLSTSDRVYQEKSSILHKGRQESGNALLINYNECLAALGNDYNERLAALYYNETLDDLAGDHTKKCEELNQYHEDQLSALGNDYNENVSALDKDYNEALATLDREHTKDSTHYSILSPAIKTPDGKLSCYTFSKPLMNFIGDLTDAEQRFLQTLFEDLTGISFDKAPISALPFLIEKIAENKQLLQAKSTYSADEIDEKAYHYTVVGGISTLVNALAVPLSDQIHLEHKLTEISKDSDYYTLTFNTPTGTKIVEAKKVILTLPFSTLRDVKIHDTVGLTEDQMWIIRTLPYGTNGKIGGPVNASRNITDHLAYDINLDEHFIGWPGEHAMTFMINGDTGATLEEAGAKAIWEAQKKTLHQLYPDIQSFSECVSKNWTMDPFSKGSYSAPTHIDLDTSVFPILETFREPIGSNLYFSGEHVAGKSRSTIEGAVRSGIHAAELILETS